MNSTPHGYSIEHYLETLRCIVAELGPQRSFLATVRRILAILAQKHEFYRLHMVIYDPQARILRLCVAGTPPITEDIVYEPCMGVTGQVFTMGQPVIVECIKDSTVFQNKFFSRTDEEMAAMAFVCLPVFAPMDETGDALEVLGTVSMDMPTAPREVLEEITRFLEVIARLIGNQIAYLQQEMQLPGREHGAADADKVKESVAALGLVCMSKLMLQAVEHIAQAGATRANVLLCGETGTGKELLAQLAHLHSARRHMPLRSINCATLPPDTLEQVFFGVQKGAFSWAVQTHKGILEECHHGTLFLNGIEYLPTVLHQGLLRAVREQEVLRLGAQQPSPANVRIISSTQKSPAQLREAGILPPELVQALSGVECMVPPLREHPEDIMPLAELFLQEAATRQGKTVWRIHAEAMTLLLRHPWLGNTRELKNCVDRAVAHCTGESLRAEDLPSSLQKEDLPSCVPHFGDAVAHFEQHLIIQALSKASGNIVEAARLLGASYRIIHYKIGKYGIDTKKYS